MDRPYVISWNLTYRCNLACEHCYLDAGAAKKRKVDSPEFADRSELSTEECFAIVDQLADVAPEAVTILTGGEPLLRRDILEIIRYAAERELWVVVGTNGVLISEALAKTLRETGVRGMALSLDSLKAETHDRFRAVKGAWQNTVDGAKILHAGEMPFIIQTTVGKHNIDSISELADFAYEELGAKVWNLYFLVQTGRGPFVSDITHEEYDAVLATLSQIQQRYLSKMMVNAKCAPHYVRHLFEHDPESPFLKSFSGGAGGCPAGTHYIGIRPNGDMTPCPYLPVFGGNLRQQGFREIWNESDVFTAIRKRNDLGGRCGTCEFGSSCGGCRARAFGVTGDYLAEDPLCSYQPGAYDRELVQAKFQSKISYGEEAVASIDWTPEAEERIRRVPRFVRGRVMRAVESYCTANGIEAVTVEELEKIRSRMPARNIFTSRQ